MDFYAPSVVVLTTGTFMSGKIWVGRASMPAGRAGESASHGLTSTDHCKIPLQKDVCVASIVDAMDTPQCQSPTGHCKIPL
jgi:hypothetical protein